MPLLTITSTEQVDSAAKDSFFDDLATTYAETMESETGYVAVSFRRIPREDLRLGRATPDDPVVVLEADVREGRPPAKRRAFAVEFIDMLHDEWAVPRSNAKVVFTEHEGREMMGYDRVGGDWQPDDGA